MSHGDRVFMMGEFEARFPNDRDYAKNHMWASRLDGRRIRFGFTAYAVRLLQDVYFLEWMIDDNTDVPERHEIGAIESKKAESSLYAPIAGRLLHFNEALLADPSTINVDKYGKGWLFDMEGDGSKLLTTSEYIDHLADVWKVTQQTIKGQLN